MYDIEQRSKPRSRILKAADQQVLAVIERICGDDFCEDLDMRAADGDLSGDLQCAHEKLSAIYRLAHSFVRSHTCYHVHEDWRSEVVKIPDDEQAEPIKCTT